MSEHKPVKILAAIQECSGLMVLVRQGGREEWLRPPERGLTREHAEALIEDAGIRVEGRTP